MEVNPFNDVEEARQAWTLRAQLWRSIHEWENCIDIWQKAAFSEIDVNEIS